MADANQINLTGNLPIEDQLAQQQLNRQQQIAQLLMQQGQQQPQGQMISGHYVAPNFFQYAAPLLNTYLGVKKQEQGDTELAKLAEKIRQGKATGEEKITNLTFGGPETVTEMAGPYAGKVPMPVAVKEGVKPDLAAALREINNPNNYGAGKDLKPLIYKQLMPDPTELERNWKAAVKGGYKGSIVDYKNQMSDAERANYGLAVARARDEGIIGGGMPSGQPSGQSVGYSVGQSGGQPTGNAQGKATVQANGSVNFAPISPFVEYQYDPSLSPKQNRDEAAKVNAENRKNMNNAKNSFSLLKSAADTLATGNPSSGFFENMYTQGSEAFGRSTPASKADAVLTIYGTKLTQQVPRFEGPQSDKDTALYQSAAGDLANPNKSIETRLAAIQAMIDINKKYYPNANWDSIKTQLDSAMTNAGQVSLGPSPTATSKQSSQDDQWSVKRR
jgi:hypothetical protein